MELNKALLVADKLKQKSEIGGPLSTGEQVILTLAEGCNQVSNKDYTIDAGFCYEIIEHYKKKTSDTSNNAIAIQRLDLDMILDAIKERL
jgi:hypothetical protein